MYAVGGCDENNMRLNTIERYHPATDTWTFVPSMAQSRSSPCVAADKYLYVMGGVSYAGWLTLAIQHVLVCNYNIMAMSKW